MAPKSAMKSAMASLKFQLLLCLDSALLLGGKRLIEGLGHCLCLVAPLRSWPEGTGASCAHGSSFLPPLLVEAPSKWYLPIQARSSVRLRATVHTVAPTVMGSCACVV